MTYKVSVKRVASVVTVREDKGLLALALGPPVHEQGRVPVDLEEQVRDVDEARGAVCLPCAGANTRRPGHIAPKVGQTNGWVVAGWQVDVGPQGRGVAITVHVGKAGTGGLVVGVLHADAVHAI